MITVAELYTRFDRTTSPSALEKAATSLLELAESKMPAIYEQQFDPQVVIRIERGSTKVWVTVATAINILVSYGGIRQSVDYLVADARKFASFINPIITERIGKGQVPAVRQRRLGVPGQLRKLFLAAERHEISSEEATRQAIDILIGAEGPGGIGQLHGLTEQISQEIHAARRGREMQRAHLPLDIPSDKAPLILATEELIPVRRRTGVIVRRSSQSGEIELDTY